MKHLRILLPLLVLALILSGCGKQRMEPYTYSWSGSSGPRTITVNPEEHTILDGTDVYTYQMEKFGTITSYVIDYPNGATYHWTSTGQGGAGGWSDNYDETTYISGSILVWALEEHQPREKAGNPAVGLLIAAVGAWQLFSPESAIYFSKGWRFKNAEPTEGYVLVTRIGGVILLIIGLVWCFI